jgi:16S rRNA processing protein RimM
VLLFVSQRFFLFRQETAQTLLSRKHRGLTVSTKSEDRWVLVARIVRARGNKGEVAAELFTDFAARLASLPAVYLSKDKSEPRETRLKKFWIDRNHPGQGIFHFESYDTINDAQKLRGMDVVLPIEQRVTLPTGQYFVSDLIGCTVFEVPANGRKLASPVRSIEEAPQVLGTVRDVYFPGEGLGGTPLLQVHTSRGELLVPLAEDICTRIDVVRRRIEVQLPEGLRELGGAE